MALFMNENDIVRLGLREGDIVSLKTAVGDDTVRRVDGFIMHTTTSRKVASAAITPNAIR